MAERKKVVTPPFRVSFPWVFTPSEFSGEDDDKKSEPKYSVTGVFHNDKFDEAAKRQWKMLYAMCDAACQEAFKKSLKDLKAAGGRTPFRSCLEKEHLGTPFTEGKFFSAMSSKQQPGLVDRDKQPIISQEDFYPGCWARATVSAYTYDHPKGGKGVQLGLHNIQKLGDDDNVTGRIAAEDEDDFDDAAKVWEDVAPELGDDDPLG